MGCVVPRGARSGIIEEPLGLVMMMVLVLVERWRAGGTIKWMGPPHCLDI